MSPIFYILGKFSVCGGAPTINAKNFSSLAFLLGHKRSLCPFYAQGRIRKFAAYTQYAPPRERVGTFTWSYRKVRILWR